MPPSSTCCNFSEQAREVSLPAFVFTKCQPKRRGQSFSIHESLPSAAHYVLRNYANLHPQNPFPINLAWFSESFLWTLFSFFQASASLPSTLLWATWLHLLLSLITQRVYGWTWNDAKGKGRQGLWSIIHKTHCSWESLEVPFNKYRLFSQFWVDPRNLQEVETGGSRTTYRWPRSYNTNAWLTVQEEGKNASQS